MRPTDLPTVPGEDWDEQLQAVEDHGEARLGRVRSRTPVWRQRGSSAMLTPSAIPKSWSARNANPESRQERQEPREETKAPSELEREVEREMLIFLREQNSRLLMQVQALSKGKGSSSGTGSSNSWERVETMELGEAPPPPPSPYVSVYTPMSPSRAGEKLETEQVRYTPNGTKVPEGLPPLETTTEAHVRVEWPESLGGPGAFAPVSQGQLQEVSQGVGAREMELQRGLAGTAARAKAREQEPARVGPRDHPEWSRGAHHEAPRFDDHERDRHRAYLHAGHLDAHRAYLHAGHPDGHRAYQHAGHPDGLQAHQHAGHLDGHRAYRHGGDQAGQRDTGHGGEGERHTEWMGSGPPPPPPEHSGDQQARGDGRPSEQDKEGISSEQPLTPREARMKWLQREVEALQIMMQSKHARPTAKESSYWDAPFETPEQKTARMFPRKGQKDIGETEERVEDSLRSFPITLPRLIEPSVQNAALQAGDWLTQVRPLIADTSTKAGTWWDQLLELTMRQYGKWLEANPLERLQISPPQESELPSGHERLEQRITNMLLAAVPTSIKDELIATRQLTPQGILFKVLRVYQPGGLGERASILSALTNTREATSAQEAVEDLRLWHRQLLRTCELKAALPDPTLLIAALDQIMRQVLAREVQATFRVNTFRMNNSVDVRPSRESVLQFYEVLLAEAETLVGSASNAMAEGKSRAVVKALVGSPHKPERTKPCSFWGTETGCRYGKNCRLVHTLLEDRNARCWNCSATTHRKAECPFLSREGESTQPTSRGSGEVGDGRGGEGKSGSKGKFKSKSSGKHLKDGKESAGEKSNDKGKTVETTSATSRSSATATTTGDGKGTDQASAMKAEADTHQQGSGETADTTKELLTEMTGLLRSLRITEPQMKVCQVMKISGGSNNMTLLDGGATHCLRKAGSDREWKEGKPIVVKLASGHAQLRQNQDTGTLLTQEDVQALIPVGKLIDIGCQLTWTRDKCRVEHLTHGVIPVELQMGCPMVDEHWGTMLMQEVEDFERRRARVRAVLACGLLAEGSHEKRVAELCSMYPQVPHRILERIPGEEEVDMVQVPLNRRQRRKIQRAEAVIIHMYSGPGEAKWRVLETMTGVVTLCFDLRLGHNVMDGHLAGYIQSIIDGGKVVAWLSGPPCRTVSACRNDYDNGPPRLRDGDGEGRFGREGLTVTQQEKADVDTVLYLKNLTWIREVLKKNPQASIVLEQPRDPQEWRPQDGGEQPSFLR